MRPLDFQALRYAVVGHVLLALHRAQETEIDVAAEAVTLVVVRLEARAPRSLRVYFAQGFKVEIVVHRPIVTAVAQVEAARGLIAVRGHYETARILLADGEETVGHGQRQRHVLHHEVCRAEYRLFAWAHLTAREFQVEVRVLGVAGSVFGMAQIERAVVSSLRFGALQVTIALCGVYVAYKTLFRLEVKRHRLALILVAALLVHGFLCIHARRIAQSHGMHEVAVEAHCDFGGVERHVLIFHVGFAVERGKARVCVVHNRVLRRIFHGRVYARLARLRLGRVGGETVCDKAVCDETVRCEAVRARVWGNVGPVDVYHRVALRRFFQRVGGRAKRFRLGHGTIPRQGVPRRLPKASWLGGQAQCRQRRAYDEQDFSQMCSNIDCKITQNN